MHELYITSYCNMFRSSILIYAVSVTSVRCEALLLVSLEPKEHNLFNTESMWIFYL